MTRDAKNYSIYCLELSCWNEHEYRGEMGRHRCRACKERRLREQSQPRVYQGTGNNRPRICHVCRQRKDRRLFARSELAKKHPMCLECVKEARLASEVLSQHARASEPSGYAISEPGEWASQEEVTRVKNV